jgi:hypothetical protein
MFFSLRSTDSWPLSDTFASIYKSVSYRHSLNTVDLETGEFTGWDAGISNDNVDSGHRAGQCKTHQGNLARIRYYHGLRCLPDYVAKRRRFIRPNDSSATLDLLATRLDKKPVQKHVAERISFCAGEEVEVHLLSSNRPMQQETK